MSGVVLRCPGCGTTQAQSGECDACFEGDVRYFCSNHSPGRWLAAPRCPECGANFGDPSTERPSPTAGGAPTVPARRTRRPGAPLSVPHDAAPGGAGARRAPPIVKDSGDAPSREDLLADFAEARARDAWEDVPWREPAAAAGRTALPVAGCLVRLVLVVLLLIVIALVGLFLVMGSLLQGTMVEHGVTGWSSGANEKWNGDVPLCDVMHSVTVAGRQGFVPSAAKHEPREAWKRAEQPRVSEANEVAGC